MTVPSSTELALMNTHPQRSDLWLSIYEPQVAMACRVKGNYDADDQKIEYDGVTTGNWMAVTDGLYEVVLVGTTLGGDEKGRTWIRNATATHLRFLESSHIDWADNDYITVLKFTEIIPIFPRNVPNPVDEGDVIFYKIYDVEYTNQNSILGSFINMGCHHAKSLDPATGECNIFYCASGTSNLLSENMTYKWSFEGATVTGSTSHTPGNRTYDTPGHYRTILQATSDSGRVDISVRHISIYDEDNPPVQNWEFIEPPSGSRDTSGYSWRIRVRTDVPRTDIRDGALVVIFGKDWYGSTVNQIGGNAVNRSSIKFVGYIVDGTIQYNYRDGFIEFDVGSPTEIMAMSECYSTGLNSSSNPNKWWKILDMTVPRAIYHYFAWHSTVLQCCDFEQKGCNRNVKYIDTDRTSLYDIANTMLDGMCLGKLVNDKQGKLWAERDVSAKDDPKNQLDVALTIEKNDWVGDLVIDERQVGEVSFVEMGGVTYNPASNVSTVHLAVSPGTAQAYRGNIERIQGLALDDGAELRQMVGDVFAFKNSRYPNIEMQLRGNFANLDIAPQEQIRLTIAEADTPRGISFSNKKFAVRGIDWMYDAKMHTMTPRVSMAEVTEGFDGTKIDIPDMPPTTKKPTGGGGTTAIPPITVPPIPSPVLNYMQIYHNGAFVGTAYGLNFIDDSCTGTFG